MEDTLRAFDISRTCPKFFVLILVLMEDTLREVKDFSAKRPYVGVLILVLMEDTLRVYSGSKSSIL